MDIDDLAGLYLSKEYYREKFAEELVNLIKNYREDVSGEKEFTETVKERTQKLHKDLSIATSSYLCMYIDVDICTLARNLHKDISKIDKIISDKYFRGISSIIFHKAIRRGIINSENSTLEEFITQLEDK